MLVSESLKRDNNNLDLIRILVATMVLWHHSYVMSVGTGIGEPVNSFLKITDCGGLGVCIFFFISGLLVTNSLCRKRDVVGFVKARFFRLFPALFVLLLISTFVIGPICTSLSLNEYFTDKQTYFYLFNNVLFRTDYSLPGVFLNNPYQGIVNGSLWTLPLEITCYIALLGTFLVIPTHKKLATAILIAIVIVACLPNEFRLKLFERFYLVSYTPVACFAVGSLLAIHQDKINVNYKLIFGFMLLNLVFWRYSNIIAVIFPLTCSFLLLKFATEKAILKIKIPYDISYGVYIWHFVIQQIIVMYFPGIHYLTLFAVSLIITYAVSTLSFVLIERKSMSYGRMNGGGVHYPFFLDMDSDLFFDNMFCKDSLMTNA